VSKADSLPPSCAVVAKSGHLNFLEPSGPLQACNGTDLPFLFGDLRLATLTALSFYYLRNVSTLDQSRKAPCVVFVCKHFVRFFEKRTRNLITSQNNSATWDLQMGFNLTFKRLTSKLENLYLSQFYHLPTHFSVQAERKKGKLSLCERGVFEK